MGVMMMRGAEGQATSGYRGGSRSPVGIGGAIAVHALVAGAFLLMPKEVIAPYVPQILIGNQIPLDPPPPPEPSDQGRDSKISTRSVADPQPAKADPVIPLPGGGDPNTGGELTGTGGGSGDIILPPIDPPHQSVLVEASVDPRALSAFQPDYPGSMIRQGEEGTVTVRVAIGPDGRVTAIERLSASDEAFWLATQRHALRKWRFRAATRDGVAVGSTKVLTIHFRLTDR